VFVYGSVGAAGDPTVEGSAGAGSAGFVSAGFGSSFFAAVLAADAVLFAGWLAVVLQPEVNAAMMKSIARMMKVGIMKTVLLFVR